MLPSPASRDSWFPTVENGRLEGAHFLHALSILVKMHWSQTGNMEQKRTDSDRSLNKEELLIMSTVVLLSKNIFLATIQT